MNSKFWLKNSLRQSSARAISRVYKSPGDKENPLKFIHVGKCGGTSIVKGLLSAGCSVHQYHLTRPSFFEQSNYFLWVRDPIKRYVSAFNHSKAIVDFDISQLNGCKPSFSNCQAPHRIQRKIDYGHAYTGDYDHLIRKFDSANHLAESLTGVDNTLKKKAEKLMCFPLEHIYKGIGWYLDNGDFVDLNYKKILFCGSIEAIKSDFDVLVSRYYSFADPPPVLSHIRKNQSRLSIDLSRTAKANVFSFYKDTDYRAIERLASYNLISEQLFELYIKHVHLS